MPTSLKDIIGGGGLPPVGRYVVTGVHGVVFALGTNQDGSTTTAGRIVLTMDPRDEESGESAGMAEARLSLGIGGNTNMKNGGFRLAPEHGVPFENVSCEVNDDAGTFIVTRANENHKLMRNAALAVFMDSLLSAAGNEPDLQLREDPNDALYEGGHAYDVSAFLQGADFTLTTHTIAGREYTKNGKKEKTNAFTTLVPLAFHGYVDGDGDGGEEEGEDEVIEVAEPVKPTAKGKKTAKVVFDSAPNAALAPDACIKDWVSRAKAAGITPEEAALLATQERAKMPPNMSMHKVAFIKLNRAVLIGMMK